MDLKRDDIIKALECCYMQELEHNENCPECPYTDLYPDCAEYLGKHAFTLINSQEQRIKELTEENNGWQELVRVAVDTQNSMGERIEKLTEEIERLKLDVRVLLDEIANEMTEDKK